MNMGLSGGRPEATRFVFSTSTVSSAPILLLDIELARWTEFQGYLNPCYACIGFLHHRFSNAFCHSNLKRPQEVPGDEAGRVGADKLTVGSACAALWLVCVRS
jgi:hypothetical protein